MRLGNSGHQLGDTGGAWENFSAEKGHLLVQLSPLLGPSWSQEVTCHLFFPKWAQNAGMG